MPSINSDLEYIDHGNNLFTLKLTSGTTYTDGSTVKLYVVFNGDGSTTITEDNINGTTYTVVDDTSIRNLSAIADNEFIITSLVTDISTLFMNSDITLENISHWDTSNVTNMQELFSSCNNFNSNISKWDTSSVTNMRSIFYNCNNFNQDINTKQVTMGGSTYNAWDVSNVTNFSETFYNCESFNQPLNNWNTSSANNMSKMFYYCSNFNQDLDTNQVTVGGITYTAWDVSNVTNMDMMFYLSLVFNKSLNNWNTSNVTIFRYIFGYCYQFNGNISNWNTSSCTNMRGMFYYANLFNQDVSTKQVTVGGNTYTTWDVSNVIDMDLMFKNNNSFNQDISKWNVSNVTSMRDMLRYCYAFNQDLSTKTVTIGGNTYTAWNVSNVTNMYALFDQCYVFTSDLSNWNVSNVNNMSVLFQDCREFTSDLSNWNISNVTDMSYTFWQCNKFNSDLTNWDTSNVTNMYGMFYQCHVFNGDVTNFNTSNVTGMGLIFSNCYIFNQNVNTKTVTVGGNTYTAWDVSNVKDLYESFGMCYNFNSDLSEWDTSNVTNMQVMFLNCNNFNSDLSGWDTSNVTTMAEMFRECHNFNSDLPWNTSNVKDINRMFNTCYSFNGDVSGWDTSQVTNMWDVFSNAPVFNQDVSKWNTSNVTQMNGMFYNNQAFNQDINTKTVTVGGNTYTAWDVSNVQTFDWMFRDCNVFASDLSNWNTSSCTGMSNMFYNCYAFNSNLNGWDVSNVVTMSNMFQNASSFNSDLDNWNTSNCGDFYFMFWNATNFNGKIGTWDITSLWGGWAIQGMLGNTSFNQDISNWDLSNVTSLYAFLYQSPNFNQSLNNWDVSNVENMDFVFTRCTNFNQPLNKWNTSNVTTMRNFLNTTSFNQDINTQVINEGQPNEYIAWDVSNVQNMDYMFYESLNFNQPLNKWNVSNVTSMGRMLLGTSFNQDINTQVINEGQPNEYIAWDVSNVRFMRSLFWNCTNFNKSVSNWNTSACTSMHGMFYNCPNFNQDINTKQVTVGGNTYIAWDTRNVQSMLYMFYNNKKFNKSISNWNLSGLVTTEYGTSPINSLFDACHDFNKPLTTQEVTVGNMTYTAWDVSNLIGCDFTFLKAKSFNQDLSSWNVSGMTSMKYTFSGASNFKQTNIGDWNLSNLELGYFMFAGCGITNDINLYQELLVKLNNNTNLPLNTGFRLLDANYNGQFGFSSTGGIRISGSNGDIAFKSLINKGYVMYDMGEYSEDDIVNVENISSTAIKYYNNEGVFTLPLISEPIKKYTMTNNDIFRILDDGGFHKAYQVEYGDFKTYAAIIELPEGEVFSLQGRLNLGLNNLDERIDIYEGETEEPMNTIFSSTWYQYDPTDTTIGNTVLNPLEDPYIEGTTTTNKILIKFTSGSTNVPGAGYDLRLKSTNYTQGEPISKELVLDKNYYIDDYVFSQNTTLYYPLDQTMTNDDFAEYLSLAVNNISFSDLPDYTTEYVWSGTHEVIIDGYSFDVQYKSFWSQTITLDRTYTIKLIVGGGSGIISVTSGGSSTPPVIPCFSRDAMILTINGEKKICDIEEGDMIETSSGHIVPVVRKMIRTTTIAKQMPYIIPKDFFGENKPNRELIISPNHAIKLKKWVKPRTLKGIKQMEPNDSGFTYYNLKLPNYHKHHLVCNNLTVESWNDGDPDIKNYIWIKRKGQFSRRLIKK